MSGLQKQFEEQRKQLENYEQKLKDVVRAYKSLEAEKKALEVALQAVGNDGDNAEGTNEAADSESTDQSLRRVLKTLTIENKKKELAFQADRKALLAKVDTLEKEVAKLSSTKAVKYKERLRQVEEERERSLADHGAVLAEMQSRYAKERAHAEQMEKQIAQLYQKLQATDGASKRIEKLEKDVAIWKQKAEDTPSVRVLREDLDNARKAHAEEMAALRGRLARAQLVESDKESRIAELEKRVMELTEEGATTMTEKAQLLDAIDALERKLGTLRTESDSLQKAHKRLSVDFDDTDWVARFQKSYAQLVAVNPNFDPYDALGLPRPEQASGSTASDETGSSNGCSSCSTAQKDLNYFKSLIGHLQKKLKILEDNHESMKTDYEEITTSLRVRISDLETAHEQKHAIMTAETKRRVAELEEEMNKQRTRMLEVVAEKEREIAATKAAIEPSDPAPPSRMLRRSTESIRTYHSAGPDSPPPAGTLTGATESRNIFYEQELSRREQEIVELRHLLRLSEAKMRDVEQASLTKDVQYLQIVETLKEEIRSLESRLRLASSEVNTEYLRNVFVQFLTTRSTNGRRHILKAIGAVLKLTPAELRGIDKW